MGKNFWTDSAGQEELPLAVPGCPDAGAVAAKTGPTPAPEDRPGQGRPSSPKALPGAGQKPLTDEERHNSAYCLRFLSTYEWIWDLRAWHKNHDYEEVKAWVEQEEPDHKNCGHAGWCIKRAKQLGVAMEDLIEAILSNNHIQYAQRRAACMAGEDCPDFADLPPEADGSLNYSDRTCWKCDGRPHDPNKQDIYTCPTCGSTKTTCGDGRTWWNHPREEQIKKSSSPRGGKHLKKETFYGNSSTARSIENCEGGSAPGAEALECVEPVVQPAGRSEVPEPGGSAQQGSEPDPAL